MSAMFPASGVPAADAKNSLPDAAVNSINCDELWYSTSRCQPRFDPAAANAMLAELLNVVMKGEVVYDCNRLDNIERAVRYIEQRGLPRLAIGGGSAPSLYVAGLDPAATRLNHGMELIFIPDLTNTGPAWLNLQGLGPKQILKGSGQSLKASDLLAGYPRIIVFYGDNWWLLGSGVVHSDIPIVGTIPQLLTGDIDAWVDWRDGNDNTGDGTNGNPFQTINGCWTKLGSIYIASPIYTIRIKLKREGDHLACQFKSYGGRVEVHGLLPVGSCRIISKQGASAADPYSFCVGSVGMSDLTFYNVAFVMRGYPDGTGIQMGGIGAGGGYCNFIDCHFHVEEDNSGTTPIWTKDGAVIGFHGMENHFFCGNHKVGHIVLGTGGSFQTLSGAPSQLTFHAAKIQQSGFRVTDVSRFSFPGCHFVHRTAGGAITGVRYRVETNSVMSLYGQTPPGDQDGTISSGGVVIP